MNKKIFLLLLTIIFALSLGMVACEQHQHEFTDNWTYDENEHWHIAVCGDTDEVSGKGKHNMVPVPGDNRNECDVCGYSVKTSVPDPEPPHQHTYAKEYSANEHCHWLEATCGCQVANSVPHGFVDGVCQTCGWWSSASDVLFANLSKSDVWNYSLVLQDVTLGKFFLDTDSDVSNLKFSGELSLRMTSNGQIDGYGYLVSGSNYVKAVIEQSVVYAYGTGVCFRGDLDELLLQNGIDIQAYIGELNAQTQEIRDYVNQLKQSIEDLPADDIVLDELLSVLIKVDTDKSTEDLTAYAADTDVLRSLNGVLSQTLISDYVNAALSSLDGTPLGVLLGDDFYGLPDRVYSLLKRKISQTVADLWAENFSLDDLFDQINGIVSQYYPDPEVNTIDELLVALGVDISEIAKPLGVNLNGVTVKQLVEVSMLASPETLWNMFQQDDASKISAEEISANLDELCQAFGDKTVYEIIALSLNEQRPDLTADYIYDLVSNAVDLLDETLSLTFYADSNGTLRKIELAVTQSDAVCEQEEIEQIRQLLVGIGGTITFDRDYKLTQDYSQVVDTVNGYYDSLESAA